VSFEFRAKDSLGEEIADMNCREFQMEGLGTVNDRWPKTRHVPGTTSFQHMLIGERREWPLTEVTMEDM